MYVASTTNAGTVDNWAVHHWKHVSLYFVRNVKDLFFAIVDWGYVMLIGHLAPSRTDAAMGLLPDTYNCGLRMRRECRERFPHYRGLATPTCRDYYVTVSFEVGGGENVPGIPGTCATRNFTKLVRGPWLRKTTSCTSTWWQLWKVTDINSQPVTVTNKRCMITKVKQCIYFD